MNPKPRILIADDSATLRRMTIHALAPAGIEMVEAESGAACLQLAQAQRLDLILLDVVMPDMDGVEACRRLKADPATAGIPVILLSSSSISTLEQATGLEAGADGYIARPISNRELVARIEALLRVKRAEDALRAANTQMQAELAARRQAEDALRQSEQRYRELVSLAQEGIWAIDANAITTYVNPRMAEMLGYTAEEMFGRSLLDFADTAGQQAIKGNLERRKQGIREQHDFQFLRKDGTVIETLIATAPSFDASGAYTGAIAVITDVTEYRRAEARLQRERKLLFTLIDNMPDFIYIKDAEARFLIANRTLVRLVGAAAPADLLGKTDADFFPPDLAERYIADDLAVIRSGRPLIGREEPMLTPSGAQGWQITTKVPLRDEAGQVIGLVGMGRDITARKQAEDERQEMLVKLERSNADLEQFAYIASHDLQEPLRMVTGFLGLLKEQYAGQLDSDADDFIGFAVDGAKRMQTLISDLLEYSRVSTRAQPFEPTDCNQVFRQTLRDLQLAIEDHAAVVTSDPLPIVLADPAQMGQLFLNLIGNALKYHGERPPVVHVSAREPLEVSHGQVWEFSVRDNGIGIDPKDHKRVFGMFQRLHGRGEYEGSGIGLAVCKKIVERHGGRIWVESQVGQGSTFFFTLPAQ
jgi:PAS domain S-box-containing protein